MYCKQCHKNVHSISHWAKKHRAYLNKRAKGAVRRVARGGVLTRSGAHSIGQVEKVVRKVLHQMGY